eukprot:3881113-Rhodomonas_salina.1
MNQVVVDPDEFCHRVMLMGFVLSRYPGYRYPGTGTRVPVWAHTSVTTVLLARTRKSCSSSTSVSGHPFRYSGSLHQHGR